ncbi:formate transporter FocA [Siccirubricoccus deserti]|uniref:Formate/nitrite transporter family protein n=1 Tax=Siccirubricoccus deserti TaxID=2013562 RepID=A0A9X0R2M6_9PROT|nr:formate/nitrite transporter family protein [Siccirubricoccus deserti]MBC4018364.1 formate/nitrite transporter family protein [Siccirubricoccus deserti]GGC64553.1 formate transporter FocA [Siccirubricoccus deserti]
MSDAGNQARTGAGKDQGPDVHPPKRIAEATTWKGEQKAGMDTPVLAVLAALAGVYIAFGGLFFLLAQAGADAMPYGAAQVLGGVVFSLGLILVLVGGAELFTGNTLMVVAWAEGRAGFTPVLHALGIAYVLNFLGSVAIALLAFWAGLHMAGDGAVGAAALRTAERKSGLGFGPALASGVAANMLVCLAVWLAFGARSAADKVLVIVPPITAFVALGLEHSVANMSLIPFGWLVKAGAAPEFWAAAGTDPGTYPALGFGGLVANLVPVTIGNLIGGVLVGAAYWFAYLRPKQASGR